MKFKSIISMAMLAATMMFAGCSEDGYWNEYSEEGKYSFAQSSASFSYVATETVSQVSVQVFRNNTNGSVTLPLSAQVSSEIITVPESVTFEAGSNVAECILSINGEMEIGVTYSATLAMDSTALSASGKAVCKVSLIKDYTWESAGACTFYSNRAGVKAKLAIQKAAEYDGNYYRIVSPYYYLEPSYCPNPGYHLYFYLDENYDPLALPVAQAIGEESSAGGEWYFYYREGYMDYCTFYREENVYYMKGLWAYTDATGAMYLSSYGDEFFQWTEGWPLAE
ncbi:MAG: hypothetical protein IJZ86_02745 [Bacteroides sp.]|nr:hypothetical protein [Bacteroides sp.]